ncbi:MAG: hypothetical protein QG567_1244 [Campylobacterota bacterium]|nr:hypothetical protein [Campylobacterota bacterium]
MKLILLYILSSLLALHAQSVSLQVFLESAKFSEAAKALEMQSAVKTSAERSEVLSGGFLLNGEIGNASAKNINRDKLEYHVSVEKNILLGNNDAYLKALNLSLDQQKTLQINRLKNIVSEHYIKACSFKEKINLLNDAKNRSLELTALIQEGVAGGEFDLSSLLRSELSADELQLNIDALKSNYSESLNMLYAYTQNDSDEPLCRDLEYEITLSDDLAEHSILYAQLESEIKTASALNKFRSNTMQDITLGVGYDDETDLTRATVFLKIPLSAGDRLENERETARLSQLNAQQQLLFTKKEMHSQIHAYMVAQETRSATLKRLNDVLILRAYQTAVLLKERFIGSEGTYLEYIDSENTLFSLLIRSVDTATESLLAKAKLYYTLGIDPQKDIK